MREEDQHTFIAAVAILGIGFMFLMTATEGKYWGKNDMDQYIVKITDGEDQAYLASDTPTALVIARFAVDPFLNRNCLQRGTCKQDVCTVEENGYVIVDGHKIPKASAMKCTLTASTNTETASSYTTQKGVQ